MFLRALPPFLMLLSLPAVAEDASCSLTGGAETCVPLHACVVERGLWFEGRAYGSREGRIEGAMSDGTLCTGSWEVRGILGMGRSDIVCDDGLKARVWYTYLDGRTGTAVGTGRSNSGERINAWSGANYADYLRSQDKAPELSCFRG